VINNSHIQRKFEQFEEGKFVEKLKICGKINITAMCLKLSEHI